MDAYRVQLRVRSSNLHVGRGPKGSVFRTSNEMRYLIGSADDAFLCCRHPAIEPHHCWIVVHEEKGVYAKRGDASFAVNGTVVESHAELNPGDVLTVGPLEFEVYFQQTLEERQAIAAASVDPVEEEISDWLINQDEYERRKRLKDKKAREYKLESRAVDQEESDESQSKRNAKPQPPPKQKKPGKLPARPPKTPASPTSDAAAEGALKSIFTRWGSEKKKKEPDKE